MLVVERLLGLRAAGGVYVPLGKPRQRPARHGGRRTSSELGSDVQDNDRLTPDEFREKLDWALAAHPRDRRPHARAASCAAQPDSCAWNGGCSYPSICRSEE